MKRSSLEGAATVDASATAMRANAAHDARLAMLAEIAVKVGVNIQRGQELIVTAPIEASPLVDLVTRTAYGHGARLVTCLYDDPAMIRTRLCAAADDTLDEAPAWLSNGVSQALAEGAARLYVVGPYPDLLEKIPVNRVVRLHAAMARAATGESRFTAQSLINWSTVPFVTSSWAQAVYPAVPRRDAVRRLWDDVFDVTRADRANPLAAWRQHTATIANRRDRLQERQYSALHFHDGRTDLTVALVEGHRWIGGTIVAGNGIECTCNIPTEEVFTCPHRERTQGRLFLSKPLALGGTIVDDVCIEFHEGAAITVRASQGQEMLEKLLATDDGARRLGEIGLVPNSSGVAARRVVFHNALFDENAASHVAFGQAYAACLGDELLSSESMCARGANESSIHIDCMLGHAGMDVDGIGTSGDREPIMRRGEFVF